jgi:hypothetical protein
MITTRFAAPSTAKADAEHSKDIARVNEDNSARIELLEQNVARLSLLAEAFWQVLQEKTQLGPAELNDYVDAVIQQRKSRSEHKLQCLACNHSSPATKSACIYCGGKLNGEVERPVFPV